MQAVLALSGNFSGSVGVSKAVADATVRMRRAVEIALKEIAGWNDHRGGAWRRAHERLDLQMDDTFGKTTATATAQMARTKLDESGWQSQFHCEILRAKAEVAAHQNGWEAPALPKWPVRHSLLFALLVALIGYGLGILSDPLKNALFPSAGDCQNGEATRR